MFVLRHRNQRLGGAHGDARAQDQEHYEHAHQRHRGRPDIPPEGERQQLICKSTDVH